MSVNNLCQFREDDLLYFYKHKHFSVLVLLLLIHHFEIPQSYRVCCQSNFTIIYLISRIFNLHPSRERERSLMFASKKTHITSFHPLNTFLSTTNDGFKRRSFGCNVTRYYGQIKFALAVLRELDNLLTRICHTCCLNFVLSASRKD